MKLRNYQIDIASRCAGIVEKLGICYLVCEVRTGKTLMALEACRLLGAKKILFSTKKKAIDSVVNDHVKFAFEFHLDVVNDESLHKLESYDYDVVIHDEHHRFGSFPKIGKFAKLWKEKFRNIPQIWLSGTPHAESYSQLFHQFFVSKFTPFEEKNFYQWAKKYCLITEKRIGQHTIRDYSNCNYSMVKEFIDPYIITLTQEQAGFSTKHIENVIHFTDNGLYKLSNLLIKTRLIDNDILGENNINLRINGEVVADTPAKMLQKLHQIAGGTCLNENGEIAFYTTSKAKFIKEIFAGKKKVIFYNFQAEKKVIEKVFGDEVTSDLNEFNTTDKSIVLQLVSGREGLNLSKAECIIYYNISFSAVTYWQSRDRLTTIDRNVSDIYFVFTNNGIETKIFEAVSKKKSYTLNAFKNEMASKSN